MSVEAECELQQLVYSDDENQSVQNAKQFSVSTSKGSSRPKDVKNLPRDGSSMEHHSNMNSEIVGVRGFSGNSSISTHGNASSGGHSSLRVIPSLGLQDHKHPPPRPPQPNFSRLQHNKVTSTLYRQCQHHCFLSDATDVRQMEQALLRLLEDFHSGKLRAFGKGCSMEHMTAIHEQQERLARLHFELGAEQELFAPLSDEGLKQSSKNMKALMEGLDQLSVSIERLHSINNKPDDKN